MDYAVSRMGAMTLTVRPRVRGTKSVGGFDIPHVDRGVHVRFNNLDFPFETTALPRRFGKSDAKGFLNIDEEVQRLGDRLPGEGEDERKTNLLTFLAQHPDNVKRGGKEFAVILDEATPSFEEDDIFIKQPTGDTYCKVCDQTIKKGPGLPNHKKSKKHRAAVEVHEASMAPPVS